jgi:hypothetical protein
MKLRPFYAVVEREMLRMMRQRTRLVAAMVRALIWLLVIGGGFNAAMSTARGVPYQDFLVPGVLGMTTLFGAMLAALTTVYDKESGVMRMMIVAPLPPCLDRAGKDGLCRACRNRAGGSADCSVVIAGSIRARYALAAARRRDCERGDGVRGNRNAHGGFLPHAG